MKEQNNENKKNVAFSLYLFLIPLMIILRDFFNISIHKNLFILVSFLLVFFSPTQILYTVVYISPFTRSFNNNYIYAIALFLIIFMILFMKKEFKISKHFYVIFLLLIYEFMHLIFGHFEYDFFIVYSITFVLIGIAIFANKPKFDYLSITKGYLYGVVVSSAIILLIAMKTYGISDVISNGIRIGYFDLSSMDQEYFISDNVNMIGLRCVIGISLITGLIIKKRQPTKIVSAMIIIVLTFLGFLTLSKTFALSLGVMLVLYSMVLVKNKKFKLLTNVITFVILAILLIYIYYPDLIQNIYMRFVVGGFSNRDNILKYYNEHIFSNPTTFLFGIGIQNILSKTNMTYSPHNFIQEIFIAWGIVGSIIVIILGYIYIKRIYKKTNYRFDLINYIPLIVFLFATLASRIFSQPTILITFIPIYTYAITTPNDNPIIKSKLRR